MPTASTLNVGVAIPADSCGYPRRLGWSAWDLPADGIARRRSYAPTRSAGIAAQGRRRLTDRERLWLQRIHSLPRWHRPANRNPVTSRARRHRTCNWGLGAAAAMALEVAPVAGYDARLGRGSTPRHRHPE